ncbi:MAG: azurin [Taibaiella sp.]|nr:azurin [Taibaiella sp.]
MAKDLSLNFAGIKSISFYIMKYYSFTLFAVLSLGLYSCGGDVPKGAEKPEFKMDQEAAVMDSVINLEAGDDMKFNRSAFTIPAGKEVTLTLKHTGKMDKNAMGHNVVILKAGEEVRAYGNEAQKAKEEEYTPQSLAAKVVAHTQLIGGGESTTLKFTIAEPGEYPFLCSFPGHYPIMKGTITVK